MKRLHPNFSFYAPLGLTLLALIFAVRRVPFFIETWRATITLSLALVLTGIATAAAGWRLTKHRRLQAYTIAAWMVPLVLSLRRGREFLVLILPLIVFTTVALHPAKARVRLKAAPFLLSFAAAILLHLVVVAQIGEKRAAAAAALAVVSGWIAWELRPYWAALPWPRVRGRTLGSVAAALALTMVILSPYARFRSGQPSMPSFFGARPSTASASYSGPSADSGGEYDGVILWPEEEKHTLLVPPLPAMRRDLFAAAKSHPLSIPFFGVYWLYKFPYRRPPPHSFETRGSPSKQSFRSADRRPLSMEAHQNFGRVIDLACCSAIEVAVVNADRFPPSVFLELMLIDSTRNGESRSLGRLPVISTPSSRQQRYSETLSFAIPQDASFSQFDEVLVRFHLTPVRSSHSAKISIEKFVFIPRT